MIKNKIKIGMFLIFGILLISCVSSAAYGVSNTQFISPGSNSFNYNYGTDVGFKYFDEGMCQAGQDFVIQVAPFGCEPAVVRSDLLEERNVPIFCQLAATKINPLIDVEAIDYISFSGGYPDGVSGVGFHPAQAAIKTSRSTLLNSPVLNNIGYAVIVLKQNRNESSMPDYIEGTLTASIRYDIKNAFGIGQATYYLPEFPDAEWKQRMNQYEFWDGKGFLRAKGIGTDSATISVYEDEFREIGTFSLQEGQKSQMVYLPGFYCMAGLEVKLDAVENPDTRVKLKVNDDVVEVAEGEKFLDNKCEVRNIDNKGITQSVEIRCETDEGRKTFTLKISPRIKLKIGNEEKDYESGDWLYKTDDNEKSVYLGYIGSKGNSKDLKDLYVYLVTIPKPREKLTANELATVAKLAKNYEYKRVTGVKFVDFFANVGKAYVGVGTEIIEWFKDSESFERVSYSETRKIGDKDIKIIGFAGATDLKISNTEYENAMKDYDEIIQKYPNEKQTSEDKQTFGEKAFQEKIMLAKEMGQKKTMLELCDEFNNKYSKSTLRIGECDDLVEASSSEISTTSISTDGIVKTISFKKITEPSLDDYSAEIKVSGFNEPFILTKNELVYLNSSAGEYMQLIDLDEDSAKVNINVKAGSRKDAVTGVFSSDTKTLKKDIAESLGGGYIFTLTDVNLKKIAKVSVVPNIRYTETKANFTFKIGIEKRAIQLSPEKINDKINMLDETIKEWEDKNQKLGEVVSGLKLACISTGTYMTIKNFFNNRNGKSIARQEVMSSDGGWYDICREEIKTSGETLDACLLKHNDDIEKDVNQLASAIENKEAITEKNLEDRLSKIRNNLGDENLKDALTSQGYEDRKITLSQARDLEKWQDILDSSSSSTELKAIATKEKNKILEDIKANAQNYAEYSDFASRTGFGKEHTTIGSAKDLKEIGVTNLLTTEEIMTNGWVAQGLSAGAYAHFYKDAGTRKEYLIIFDADGIVQQTYGIPASGPLSISDANNPNPLNFKFKKYDATSYKNKYDSPEVRFFETDPYKGYPAIVPISVSEGWYAATEQIVSGTARAYDASGRVVSFKLCNVGANGKAEYHSGIGDDICQGFNVDTGQIYGEFPGLDEAQTKKLVGNAREAIRQAQVAHQQGKAKGKISILRQKVQVGEPMADIPGTKCQDFMSAKDCWILFNVCDPVICPSSRCDLGGAYPVKDVVQSGIFGSIALCLPNWAEKIYIPVCLTGIHAGIDSLLSVYKNYRDCLQHSLETGETVGICDQINSLYGCEFFWRQAAPISKALIPKLLSKISGQGTRGGGEYLGVLDAWKTAEDSVNYMVKYYGEDAYRAFNARSTDDVGSAFCKSYVSVAYPSGGDFLDALIEPDSPSQYSAWFQEIPFTTATVPPISQYKVFYHIYAGKDRGAYYRVYLKSPSGTSFYYDNPTRTIATGYIPSGDYASETTDFTAPSGYKELCINVNGQDECGFGQVSTSFAVDYVEEKYIEEQTTKTDINSEQECVSGSASWYGFANPNLQAGAEQALDPQLYNMGIVRVCATDNPGKATDSNWQTENARWKDVGYCGNEKMRCWIDTDSVKDIIQNTNIENEILGEVTDNWVDKLQAEGNYIYFEKEKEKIENFDNIDDSINYITDNLISRAIFNNEKAWLLLARGYAYGELAKFNKPKSTETPPIPTTPIDGEKTIKEKRDEIERDGVITKDLSDEAVDQIHKVFHGEPVENWKIISPVFQFNDGQILGDDLSYAYSQGKGWMWATNGKDWFSAEDSFLFSEKEVTEAITQTPSSTQSTAPTLSEFDAKQFIKAIDITSIPTSTKQDIVSYVQEFDKLSDKNKNFIISLQGKSYEDGLSLLVDRTWWNEEGWGFDSVGAQLSTNYVDFSKKNGFKIKTPNVFLFFKYSNNEWWWSLDSLDWVSLDKATFGKSSYDEKVNKVLLNYLRSSLQNVDAVYESEALSKGAIIIFGTDTGMNCQKVIGEKIIQIALQMKSGNPNTDDKIVYADTGAKSFECLVLQVAIQESSLRHCEDLTEACETSCEQVLPSSDSKSYGVMQINTNIHKDVNAKDFEENVKYGINLLIDNYNPDSKSYGCAGKNYAGWTKSLRYYNGWNTDCSKGDVRYVENVLNKKSVIAQMFPEECGEGGSSTNDLSKSVVKIESTSFGETIIVEGRSKVETVIASGTGFLIFSPSTNSLKIITAYHIIYDGSVSTFFFSEDSSEHLLVEPTKDENIDAVLFGIYFKEDFPSLNLGDSDEVEKGEILFFLGYSKSSDKVVKREGKFLRFENNLVISNSLTLSKAMIINVEAGEGFSGSPLFNSRGEVVGVVVADRKEIETIAVPINKVKDSFSKYLNL